jgi:multidrug efflux pump subunit AcrA (membrane-fusion protein)
MKRLALLAALVATTTSFAESPNALDLTNLKPVASPNRLAPSVLASAAERTKPPAITIPTNALSYVDATGKVVARVGPALYSAAGFVTVYNSQPMVIDLSQDYDPNVGGLLSNGLTWAGNLLLVYYASSDCSGTPLYEPTGSGAQYRGLVVSDDGQPRPLRSGTLVIVDATLAQQTAYGSIFNGSCFQPPPGGAMKALTPAAATFPSTMFGTPPFLFK